MRKQNVMRQKQKGINTLKYSLTRMLNAMLKPAAITFIAAIGVSNVANASYLENADVKQFVAEMVEKHDFNKSEIEAMFAQAEKKQSILDAIARPAEKRLEWKGYRKIFLTKDRITRGKTFLTKYADTFERAEKEFGVPKNIIAAIIGVETRYGKNRGSYRVIDALSTLAFDYPPRSKFFKKELEQVLLLSREQSFKPLDLKGSYAGAMGYGQFIPSSYRNFAVDFDGDGVADILNNPIDAIGSVANYFKEHGWKEGQPITGKVSVSGKNYEKAIYESLKPKFTLEQMSQWGVKFGEGVNLQAEGKLLKLEGENGTEFWVGVDNFYVITRYNHSSLYAMAVYQLSEELK